MEKKKKKKTALLEIAQLNANDKDNTTAIVSESETVTENMPPLQEPSPKRLRTESELEENKLQQETNDKDALGPSKKPKLSGEEYLKLKKALRERSNQLRIQPRIWLRDVGTSASLNVNVENRVPLFLSDIQHLIMYSIIGCHAPYNPARWCQLDKFNKLQNTCVVVVESLSMYDYISHESLFPFISSTFEIKLEFLNPESYSGNFIQDLVMVPITGEFIIFC